MSIADLELLVGELRAQLVERDALILAQAEVIAELRSEVADLKARFGKDSGNSSAPPSRDRVDRRERRAVGLVNPSTISALGARDFWTYTLEDLVQGKVVRALEDRGIEIRVIRRVVESVRSSVHPKPLASLNWGTSGTEVFVGFPDGGWVGAREPSQNVLTEVINLDQIRLSTRTSLQRPAEQEGRLEQRRSSLGHKPVFAGTRIAVATVAAYLKRGIPVPEILEAFPDLTESDVALAGVDLAKAS